MSKKLTQEEVVEKLKKVHGNKYDYSLLKYINSRSKVDIICREHGIFKQNYSSHLKGSGCAKCFGNNIPTLNCFINDAKKIHGDKYNYSLVKYINARTYIKIICNEHGVFNQTPYAHLSGQGCYECGRNKLITNPTGWTKKEWEKASKKSNNFDSFKVYIIKCWNEEEEFYKVGRTFMTVKRRFKTKSEMPYNYKIVKELVFDNAIEEYNKENEIKLVNKLFKYIPNIVFKGRHECFTTLIDF